MRTISVNTGSYAPWGSIPGEPTRPEPNHEALRTAEQLRESKLLAERKWTGDTLAIAQGYGFPKPIGRVIRRWGFSGDLEPVYSRSQVAQWFERVESDMRQLLG